MTTNSRGRFGWFVGSFIFAGLAFGSHKLANIDGACNEIIGSGVSCTSHDVGLPAVYLAISALCAIGGFCATRGLSKPSLGTESEESNDL
jgi:hypothetical protein